MLPLHVEEANLKAGERFSEALLAFKERAEMQFKLGEREDAKLTSQEQFQAASWACLNRRERRERRFHPRRFR